MLQQNNEADAKNVEVELTIDGEAHTIGLNALTSSTIQSHSASDDD